VKARYPMILQQHTFMSRCRRGNQVWICYAENEQSAPLCPECNVPMEIITEMDT
jgi:hypothetical protein